MTKKELKQPTELELLVLKVLWNAKAEEESGNQTRLPMPVREIREDLKALGKDLAHTSVITMLNIMVDKKFVRRSKRKNAFHFSPLVQKDDVQSQFVDDIVHRVFDGAANSLVLSILKRSEVNEADLAEIQRLIQKKS